MSVPPLPSEVDTIVVGAGTGGAACAAILATHSSSSTLLLEAGPDYGAFGDAWPADILDGGAIPLSHDWGLVAGSGLDLPRAKVVGGCSAHNGCTISRGAREDYDHWARLGNPGWESATVEPLLDWAHAGFRVRRYQRDELTSAQSAFVDAGIVAGLPYADDLDHIDAAVGIGGMPVNIVDGVRWNAGFAFLDAVRDRPHLTIAPFSHVDRLVLRGTRVEGVEVRRSDGTLAVVRAQRVVLAGGAYLTPAILQRSGIGPAADLSAAGVTPVLDLPGVGANLLDHACVQLDFHGKDGLLEDLARTPWHPDEQTVGRARSSLCDAGPYDIHVFMVAGANSGHPGLPPITLYGGAMRARSGGRVLITGADPAAAPTIDHRYGSDPGGHDRQVLSEALDLLRTMTAEPRLAAVLGAPADADGDPFARIASYCHPAGTCAMGPADDPGAVVDATGSVHGLDGVHVADASLMPHISRGNINLPTAMIGARIAAGLLGISPRAAAGHATTTEHVMGERA